ncbi:tetratricopeptide repeat protein [Oceanirhabdus sp. W0125-5]|uniref:tetratricopeptide repeat protein n=1 Tax=Oceanirhabdus sp. W0125-5 TaxID=2999116 RepID=UPI0022F3037E|nr:tetratricopeptide repeat protein [Oceanirhabdus sp. W0125-5]WBW95836.1 tetratricopeptide repeat protein [Oceanirhabdus sp. W0125-5]
MKILDRIAWFYSVTHTRKLFKKKDYKTALEVASAAYDKAINAFGPGHLKTAQTCYNLVVLNTEIRNFEEAEKYGIESLKIMENLRGKDHFTLLEDLRNLQYMYKEWGKADKVEELEKRINNIIDPDGENEKDDEEKELIAADEVVADEEHNDEQGQEEIAQE